MKSEYGEVQKILRCGNLCGQQRKYSLVKQTWILACATEFTEEHFSILSACLLLPSIFEYVIYVYFII